MSNQANPKPSGPYAHLFAHCFGRVTEADRELLLDAQWADWTEITPEQAETREAREALSAISRWKYHMEEAACGCV